MEFAELAGADDGEAGEPVSATGAADDTEPPEEAAGTAGAALAGAAAVDPGLAPLGSSIEAKSPPAGAPVDGMAGAGGVTVPPEGAAGAALVLVVGVAGAVSVAPVPVGAASVVAPDPPGEAGVGVLSPVAELAESDPLEGDAAGAGGVEACGDAGGVEAEAAFSAERAELTSAMRPPKLGASELAALDFMTAPAALPMFPSVATARPRPDAPCAPASPHAAFAADAMPPVALAAPTVAAAAPAPAPMMPAAKAPPVAAAPPAVNAGLPDSIEAANAGVCIAMYINKTDPPMTVMMTLNFSPPGPPSAAVSCAAHVAAWVLPMPTIRYRMKSFTPVATA